MIAAFVNLCTAAFEMGEGVDEQWNTVSAELRIDPSELVLDGCGELACDSMLFFAKYIDGEVRCIAENLQARRMLDQTPQDQRWIE